MNYPKVLIADDDDNVRNAIVSVVRNTLPSAVLTAVNNGKKALDIYRRQGADLVISNFFMPVMTGPDFVKTLREEKQNVPIIMVSGDPDAEAAGRNAGIDRFVHKLSLFYELPREIHALLGTERVGCLNRYLNG